MVEQPMKITAQLRGAIVSDPWLPLDGTLFWSAQVDRGGAFDPDRLALPTDLPLAVRGHSDDWYYAISFAQPATWWAAEGRGYWTKKFDLGEAAHRIDFGKRKGVVMHLGGPYKAKHMPVFYRVTRQIEWFALGDPVAIRTLLGNVRALGKFRGQGWGAVSEWRVEPWPEDWSVWHGDQLVRAVPADQVTGNFEYATYAIRPPYYRDEHLRRVAIAGWRGMNWFEATDYL